MSPKSRISLILVAVVFAGAFCIAGISDADAQDAVEATTYEIQYEVEGATQSFTGTSQTVTLKSLAELGLTAPEGKTFTGWQQYDTTITVAVGSVVTLTAGTPIKFVAQFATTQYVITFVDGYTLVSDDVYKTISQTKVDYNGTVSAPADPVREGTPRSSPPASRPMRPTPHSGGRSSTSRGSSTAPRSPPGPPSPS